MGITEALARIESMAFVAGIAAQAVITWWRVNEMTKRVAAMEAQLSSLHGTEHRLNMLERRVFNGAGGPHQP